MTDLSLTILPETADDAVPIERLHERTFGPGRYAKSAYRLREGIGHGLDLSFTARIGTLLVGSVWLTPISSPCPSSALPPALGAGVFFPFCSFAPPPAANALPLVVIAAIAADVTTAPMSH